MPHERFFLDAPLRKGESVSLGANEFHHLSRVMRARIGDQVELVNGKNQLAHATVSHLGKEHAALKISELFLQERTKPTLILAQAIPRFNRLEYILEKGTELNVTQFWLFPGMFSEKEEVSPNQHTRMAQITVAAMKQCGRLDLPTIHIHPPLLQWTSLEGELFFGDPSSSIPFSTHLFSSSPTVFFIGPERGLASQEVDFLQERLSAQGVRLHTNTLRVDTAAIVALSLLSK